MDCGEREVKIAIIATFLNINVSFHNESTIVVMSTSVHFFILFLQLVECP